MLLREHSLSPASSINLIICHKVSWPEQGYQELAVIQASAYLQSHGQGQEDAFSCSGASKHSVTFPFPSCISISGSFLENICLRHKRYRIGGRGWMHSNSSLLETSLWAENTIVMEKKKKKGFPFTTSNSAHKEGLLQKTCFVHIVFWFPVLFLTLTFYPNFSVRDLAFVCMIYELLKKTLALIPG